MKSPYFAIAPVLASSVIVAGAEAQTTGDEERTLDPITVVGLRPVDIEDVTVSVTVLTEEDFAVRNSPFVVDELRAIPGLAVSRNGAVGGLTQVRLRGAEANQTLVLVDGIEVSDPVTGETDFGLWSGLDAGRVEVLRGEQSTFYGSDAIGGVINIVTNKDTSFAALAEVGSRGSWRLDARGGIATDNAYLVVSTGNNITGGADTSGLDGETDGTQQYSGTVRAGLEAGGWQFSALARYANA
ncbi:MAG: TonB-dependent receptor plug domain-containing protein, partial [Pseudomonadota bacterium]